jgi:parallel beta-helix repeat protein
MKYLRLITAGLLLSLFSSSACATEYFVATDGDDNNDGTSINSPWRTLVYAASSSLVNPGDTVYVKAGTADNDVYNGNVIFSRGGTSGSPVTFEGYTNTPGDNPELNYQLNDPLQAQVMPLFNGGDRAVGVAFDIRAPYVTIRNLQITEYSVAVHSWGADYHHAVIENIIAVTLGKLGGAGGYEYSGKGITLAYSSNNHIKNCIIVNANAEGVSLVGNENLIENTRIYSNEVDESTGADGTDYYIVIKGNNNIVRGCYAERIVPDVVYNDPQYPHVGAGIGFKESAENNLVEDCVAKNLNGGFYVRWVGARNNIFRRCKAYGADFEYVNYTNNSSGGFICRNGAENNLFESCSSEGCTSAVQFYRSASEGAEDNSDYAALNNRFVNCIFTNSKESVIDFNPYSGTRPDDAVLNNSFINCTIYKAKYLISSNRPNQGNKMINCIISNVETLQDPGSSVALHFSFENSCFFNGFAPPAGLGNISGNPLFVNSSENDFHLAAGSPCIDAGKTSVLEAEKDRDRKKRPIGAAWDMGAYEYGKASSILFLALPAIL